MDKVKLQRLRLTKKAPFISVSNRGNNFIWERFTIKYCCTTSQNKRSGFCNQIKYVNKLLIWNHNKVILTTLQDHLLFFQLNLCIISISLKLFPCLFYVAMIVFLDVNQTWNTESNSGQRGKQAVSTCTHLRLWLLPFQRIL